MSLLFKQAFPSTIISWGWFCMKKLSFQVTSFAGNLFQLMRNFVLALGMFFHFCSSYKNSLSYSHNNGYFSRIDCQMVQNLISNHSPMVPPFNPFSITTKISFRSKVIIILSNRACKAFIWGFLSISSLESPLCHAI